MKIRLEIRLYPEGRKTWGYLAVGVEYLILAVMRDPSNCLEPQVLDRTETPTGLWLKQVQEFGGAPASRLSLVL